jgi:hypothetical protein
MSPSFIRTIVGAALLSVGLLAVLPARADDLAAIDPQARTGAAGWRVDGITGEASAHLGAAPGVPLAVGQVLSFGSDVATGAGAVVFLSRNGDRLIIQPNSHLRIDAPGTAGLLDHFMQSLGSVFYDVEPRKNRSFGITAPYVAAIIKGTRFLVTVEPGRNSVRVDRGRVLVESTDGVSSVLVDAGTVATAVPALARGVRLSASGIPNTAPTDTTEAPGAVETPASNGTAATGASAVNDVTGAVSGTVDGVAGAVGGVADGVGKTVGGAADAVGDAVGAAADATSNAVASAGAGVSDIVGGTTDTVGGVVGGVTNTVGGVVGGVGGGLGGLLGGKN